MLGIVVDDAIIIGESAYTTIRADGHTLDNVIKGARKVAIPATFGVLTTIAAFAPMLFVGGIPGPFFEAMSVVVILCLLFSLVESKLILPAHLVHAKISPINEEEIFSAYDKSRPWRCILKFFQRFQRHVQHGLHKLINNIYKPWLEKAVDNRGITLALFIGILIVTGGLMSSGMVRTVLFPKVPGDFIVMELAMQSGAAIETRNAAMERLESAILGINGEYLAEHPGEEDPVNHVGAFGRSDNTGIIFAEISKNVDRKLEAKDITEIWRERAGEIAGVKDLTFSSQGLAVVHLLVST